MATSNKQANDHATSLMANSLPANDILAQGNTLLYDFILYENNFNADISALEESGKEERDVGDSGYFSSENFDSKDGVPGKGQREISYAWSIDDVDGYSFFSDIGASTEVNHGSTYEGIANEDNSSDEKGEGSKRQTRSITNFNNLSLPEYSRSSDKITGPTSLQRWVQTKERHESLAYRLEQPAKKRRKAAGGR